MLRINRKKGFSFVEIVVIIAILVVLLAVFTPMLISNVETSRMQKDDSTMDELVNAVQLALADPETFDEAHSYCIPNNYVTYTDSSGVYGTTHTDEEFWAPDGSGYAVTITFNPDENGTYTLADGIVNDMTYGNGSVADSRVVNNVQQCYFSEMGNKLLYSAVQQSIGSTFSDKSATYKNSSYTVFITFDVIDTITKTTTYGEWNGTNLDKNCPASLGSGTSSYTEEKQPETTKTGGTTESNFTNSDLCGSETVPSTPSYKQPINTEDDTTVGNIIPVGGTYYVGVTNSQTGYYTGATEIYTEGQPFPKTVNTGDIYVYGDYEYRYDMCFQKVQTGNALYWGKNTSQNGWGVRVLNNTKTIYGKMLSEINGKPVVNMQATFYGCTKIKTVPAIPNSITNMKWAYHNCQELTTVPTIPSGVTDITETFYNCKKLVTIPEIPSSVTEMSYAFAGCTSLTTTPSIPNGVTDLTYTFYNCSSLITPPTIPSSVTNMQATFYGCSKLKTAPTIPYGVTNMNSTFFLCTSLETAPEIPNSVTNMVCTFYQCYGLKTVSKISDNVTNMKSTFYDCRALTTVPTIPGCVTNMPYSFYQAGVREITFNGTKAAWNSIYKYSWDTRSSVSVIRCTDGIICLQHRGGTATCLQKAVCEYCNQEYGEIIPHNFNPTTQICEICNLKRIIQSTVIKTVSPDDFDYENSDGNGPRYQKIISFSPTEDGEYAFRIYSSTGSAGIVLFDDNMSELKTSYTDYWNAETHISEGEIRYNCTAGTNYKIGFGAGYHTDRAEITLIICQYQE